MALKHDVYDTGTPFSIDPVSREIKNESLSKITLMQYDHNSERFTFKIPRYIDGHDMSLCNVVQVHYTNIDAKTRQQSPGVYEVVDMHVSEDNEDIVICTWLVSCNVTKFFGTVSFLLRFSCTEEDGTVRYVWNTAVFKDVTVSTGIYNGETVLNEYVDVLEAWKMESDEEIEAINAILQKLIDGGS